MGKESEKIKGRGERQTDIIWQNSAGKVTSYSKGCQFAWDCLTILPIHRKKEKKIKGGGQGGWGKKERKKKKKEEKQQSRSPAAISQMQNLPFG